MRPLHNPATTSLEISPIAVEGKLVGVISSVLREVDHRSGYVGNGEDFFRCTEVDGFLRHTIDDR